jgi:hypothetical protein
MTTIDQEFSNKSITTIRAKRIVADLLGLETLLRYVPQDETLDNEPVVISRCVGTGRLTHVCVWLNAMSTSRVGDWKAQQAGAQSFFSDVPSVAGIAARQGSIGRVSIAINWNETPRNFFLAVSARSSLDDTVKYKATLPPGVVSVMAVEKVQ